MSTSCLSPVDSAKELSLALSERADDFDATSEWPKESLRLVAGSPLWLAAIAKEFGGLEMGREDLLTWYRGVAGGDLSVALIVSQRRSAIKFIQKSSDRELKKMLTTLVSQQETYLTIGISHVTTSEGGAGIVAKRVGKKLVLQGRAPWVTGAKYSDGFMLAATAEDGAKLVAWVPRTTEGIVIGERFATLALQQSWTAPVDCHDVTVPEEHIVVAPTHNAIVDSVTSYTILGIGVGHIDACLGYLEQYLLRMPTAMQGAYDEVKERHQSLIEELGILARESHDDFQDRLIKLRVAINDLLVRLAGFLFLATKGKGYVRGTKSERLAREALFFCVWSIPNEVRALTSKSLLGI